MPTRSRYRKWKPVTSAEMKNFVSRYLLTRIIRKPLISQYWSTNPLIRTLSCHETGFNQSSSSYISMITPSIIPTTLIEATLYKIRPVVDYLMSKVKTVYTPGQDVDKDEEILLWKGRVSIKQYIPSKRVRFGKDVFSQ